MDAGEETQAYNEGHRPRKGLAENSENSGQSLTNPKGSQQSRKSTRPPDAPVFGNVAGADADLNEKPKQEPQLGKFFFMPVISLARS